MRCKNCPAYWEDVTPMVGVEDWGCYCNPEAGSDAMREFADGDCGCNRKLPYIKKIMAKVEQEKEIEMKFHAIQYGDFVKFMTEQDTLKKIAAVICNDIGIGVSAESILAYCTGVKNSQMYPPSDADDFKRCHNLLSAFPEWKEEIKDIGKTYKAWGTIGEHWKEIEGVYLKEDWKSVNQMLEKYSREKYEER